MVSERPTFVTCRQSIAAAYHTRQMPLIASHSTLSPKLADEHVAADVPARQVSFQSQLDPRTERMIERQVAFLHPPGFSRRGLEQHVADCIHR
jgi:hypothetical protein